ncbi:MAG: bifunctional homocysteine S-methyltransferase/methylenetetrahydrofolate reductase [Candidatus Aminicenantes bacterium]|nr:bifunctional homocysteine S-methyltransferase/methylenetetrahydrofolate reductase [Candidatus Aminicenantes bacterium]
MKNRFLDALADRVLLCDGGMGTVLYGKGVYLNTCFDELNLTNPAIVKEVHREYVESGVDIIETNTFGANRLKLRKYGLNDKVGDINRTGAAIAREEAGAAVFVAGSIGPLGARIAPLGPLSAAEAEDVFAEQAAALGDGGVDLIILETFSDLHEIAAAIKAVRRASPALPLVAEMTIDEDGNSHFGTTPEVFTAKLEDLGVDVIGVNCSVGPAPMLQCVERMAKVTARPLAAMPNAGMPREVEGRNIYLCSPDYMAEYAKRFIQSGVKVIGGCCGTTPAHIRAMKAAVKAHQPPRRAIASPLRPAAASAVLVIPLREKSDLGKKLADRVFVTSVEIVPPRGHDPSAAIEAARALGKRGVDCVNIPDGPRASARMSPMALASILTGAAGDTGLEVLLHYTCRDRNLLGMQSDFLGLQANKIRNMLIITGDPPKLGDYPSATPVFDVDSIGLTSVVNGLNRGVDIGGKAMAKPTSFLLGVGVNPGAINLENEIARFERKIEAGAEFAITQPVFDIGALERFLARTARFRVPILGGIWPLWSLANAEFMHNEVPGASVPAAVMERMRRAQDKGPEFARAEGVAIAREVLSAIKGMVQGVQVSPPLGKCDLALEVLEAL